MTPQGFEPWFAGISSALFSAKKAVRSRPCYPSYTTGPEKTSKFYGLKRFGVYTKYSKV